MTYFVKKVDKRDRRLSIALLLLVICAGSLLIQAWILLLYFRSAIHQDWTHFLKIFPSFALPPQEPGVYCFDDCFPDLPFVAGWIGIVSFFLGLSILAYSWWMSKSRDSP